MSSAHRNLAPILPLPNRSHLEAGLAMLLQARTYAAVLDRGKWDFAVEIRLLREAGLSNSDLRWLACQGHVEHGIEMTLPGAEGRTFVEVSSLAFAEDTCFLLTADGAAFVRRLGLGDGPAESLAERDRGQPRVLAAPDVGPRWDSERRELTLGHLLVKQFRQPAEAQELILSVFEEEGWPARIDDPLPPMLDQDPKRHLHITITNLNRHQKNHLIRFRGDGTGRGIFWERLHRCSSAAAERG